MNNHNASVFIYLCSIFPTGHSVKLSIPFVLAFDFRRKLLNLCSTAQLVYITEVASYAMKELLPTLLELKRRLYCGRSIELVMATPYLKL